jgi:hypothetical protein
MLTCNRSLLRNLYHRVGNNKQKIVLSLDRFWAGNFGMVWATVDVTEQVWLFCWWIAQRCPIMTDVAQSKNNDKN